MKTLILSDEMYARLAGLPGVADVLAGTPVPMPSDRDLVLAARIGETPLAFERTVEYRDAGRQAAEDTRLDLGEMIHHAHAAGVGPATLARWASIRPRRIYEVLAQTKAVV